MMRSGWSCLQHQKELEQTQEFINLLDEFRGNIVPEEHVAGILKGGSSTEVLLRLRQL